MKNVSVSSSSYQYHSYLVRLWQDGEGMPWVVSIKHVATGEKMFFDGLECFFAFLRTQTETTVDHNPLFSQKADK